MKYKIIQTQVEVVEDNELMKGLSLSRMQELTGHGQAYLSRVRSGAKIVSQKKYLDFKAKLGA